MKLQRNPQLFTKTSKALAKILINPVSIEVIEKKSRFIGFGESFFNVEEFETYRKKLKAKYRDANHVAWAYRIQEKGSLQIRFYDDGEVSGTAGKPIYNFLEGNDLINCALFVVRYFGGIKLGAGGLVRAYGKAAREIINSATIEEFVEKKELVFEIPYDQQRQLDYRLEQINAQIVDREFSENIKYKIIIPSDKAEEFMSEVKTID